MKSSHKDQKATEKHKRGWPPRRRKAQAARCRKAKPWKSSTGPRSAKGKARACMNALKHAGFTRPMREMRHILGLQKRFLYLITRHYHIDLNPFTPYNFPSSSRGNPIDKGKKRDSLPPIISAPVIPAKAGIFPTASHLHHEKFNRCFFAVIAVVNINASFSLLPRTSNHRKTKT